MIGRALALMLVATLCFALMSVTVKWLGPGYSPVQLLFFRNLFALLPVLVMLLREGDPAALRTRHPGGHLLRATVGLVSLGAFFFAFQRLPIASVTAISFAAPIFVTALSVPLLGERVGVRRWLAVGAGFLGVLLILRPGAGSLEAASLVALSGAFLYALVMIQLRRLNRTERPSAIVFYYVVTSVAVSGLLLPLFWTRPSPRDWLLLLALGIVGGLAQLALTTALRHAEASTVAPFDYATILWTALLGYLLWGEQPDAAVWAGVAVVVASGLYISRRETRLAREARLAAQRGSSLKDRGGTASRR